MSILTIIIRRHFFRRRFRRIVQTNPQARARVAAVQAREAAKRRELLDHLWPLTPEHRSDSRLEPVDRSSSPSGARPEANGHTTEQKPASHWHARRRRREKEQARERIKKFGIRADMVRRVDEPVRINAMSVGGHLDTHTHAHHARGTLPDQPQHPEPMPLPASPDQVRDALAGQEDRSKSGWMAHPDATADDSGSLVDSPLPEDSKEPSEPEESVPARERRNSDSAAAAGAGSSGQGFPRSVTLGEALFGDLPNESAADFLDSDPRFTSSHTRQGSIPRTTTIEFREPRSARFPETHTSLRHRNTRTSMPARTATRRQSLGSVAGGPTALGRSRTNRGESMHTGFGGFPNPVFVAGELGAKLIRKAIPATATMPPRTATLQSVHSTRLSQDLNRDMERAASKPVTYISFDVCLGHRLAGASC